MSKENSPSYAQGVSDAEVDNALVSNGKPPDRAAAAESCVSGDVFAGV